MHRYKYHIVNLFRAFFPLQLLFGHVKYNLFSLFFWVLLFGIVADTMGSSFGIPYLLYSPEYRGVTGFTSFFLIGFALGGFTISFHTYSYMRLGKRYPFILTVSRPFIKFCLNNSVIPLLFIGYYIWRIVVFHRQQELAGWGSIAIYIFALLLGFSIFVAISLVYFFPRNTSLFNKIGVKPSDTDEDEKEPVSSFLHRKENLLGYFQYDKHRRYVYFTGRFRLLASRSVKHYEKESLEKIVRYSRISSSLFELITIITFLLLGIFREHPLLDLPAGMSIIMLMSITIMIFSALRSWFHYWTYPIFIVLVVCMNQLSLHTKFFQYRSYAFGMNYSSKKLVPYTFEHIRNLSDEIVTVNQSRRNYLAGMNAWKARTKEKKPKLVIVLTSGGGSRSALWTFSVLQHLNDTLNGKLLKHTQLITGASGGMIGAAYYRSLYLNQLRNKQSKANLAKYREHIARDLLNKLSFTAYSNDIFFRVQDFDYNGNSYTKDRGYSFEQNINENTDGVLNGMLSDYAMPEQQGLIPCMIFSPTIVNDGRRLLIASQPLNFMCSSIGTANSVSDMYECVDFQTMFKDNNQVRFLSVLRMSATFPLVLPMVSMPTKPEMHVMDAGVRDNYGGKVMMNYLFSLRDWINQNTSGVIIVKIRDTKKILDGESVHKVSMLNKLTLPFGNMYKNFTRTQDFDQDELIRIGAFSFDFPVDMVVFNLRENSKDRISLSWHLTALEKEKIVNTLESPSNKHARQQLFNLLR